VRRQRLRGLILILAAGCAEPTWEAELASNDPRAVAEAFVDHSSFRQAALEASLNDPIRDYGLLRLEHYTSDWNRLPVWDPAGIGEALPETDEALLALGRRAFLTLPMSPSRQWPDLVDPTTLAWADDLPALSCASCHSAIVDGERVLGLPDPSLDLSPTWPLGTVDPTSDGMTNPTTVADLRVVRHQAALHWSGTLDNSLAALAVRIDTLLITDMGAQARPPRVAPVAIAAWLWSLAETLPPIDTSHAGAGVFDVHCAACHGLDGVAEPVLVDVVGTDPAAADSSTRGTGRYRVPSLRGVGQRSPLLHDGSVHSLDVLLDSQRMGGHSFGQELDDADRALLLGFLGTL
jgi:hypothetical protein